MVQVENEIGMLESARDYSEEANRLFQSAIPEELADYLVKNKKTLHPWLAEKWQKAGGKTEGNKDAPPVAGWKMAKSRG